MNLDEPHARIGHRGSAISRAKQLALKGLVFVGGAVMLVSAFVVSLTFLAIGLVVVLIAGGYLWWQTRDLRKQLRARMQEQTQPPSTGNIIEGEVVSPDRTGHRESPRGRP
jgi:protein-S-isoprenylcysteine O-methyltransferase Ste14